MVQNVKSQVAALRGMTPAQLRDKYLEVFGEPTRTGNKDFLCQRLAWRLQSVAEGTLSEWAKQRAAELARDADIRTTMPRPPAVTPRRDAPTPRRPSQRRARADPRNRAGPPVPREAGRSDGAAQGV